MKKSDQVFLWTIAIMVLAFTIYWIWQIFLPMSEFAGIPEDDMAAMLTIATILLSLAYGWRFTTGNGKAPVSVQEGEAKK